MLPSFVMLRARGPLWRAVSILTSLTAVASAQGVAQQAAGPRPACASSAAHSAVITPELSLATFDSAWSIIHVAHFDTAFNGVNWLALREELRPRAAAASDAEALRAVIRTMLERLGQSHFALIPLEAAAPEDPAPHGAGETGITLRVINGDVIVLAVEPASPAASAGIAPGWVLTAVDGCPAGTLLDRLGAGALDARTGRLRARALIERRLDGPTGSTVRLTLRDGDGARRDLELRRAAPRGEAVRLGNLPPIAGSVTSVVAEAEPGVEIAIIHFDAWLPTLAARIDSAIDAHRGASGFVLDLRGNPGGVGIMVSGVAGHFTAEAHLLGILRMRSNEMRFSANPRRVNARGDRVEPVGAPLAILVDEATGSTSEMFAGALQDLGRARIFGDTTAGHVLPAIAQRLPNGDVLYHAVADFVLPDGTRLEGRGVVPDVTATTTRSDLLAGRDRPLEAALKWLAAEARGRD